MGRSVRRLEGIPARKRWWPGQGGSARHGGKVFDFSVSNISIGIMDAMGSSNS